MREDRINELEGISIKFRQSEQQRENKLKKKEEEEKYKEQAFRDLWDNNERDICIIGGLEKEERVKLKNQSRNND